MENSILVALKGSMGSRTVVDYLIRMPLSREDVQITLLHVSKRSLPGEEFMGETFTDDESSRFQAILEEARARLGENGFNPDKINIELVSEPYPTVAEGIIARFNKEKFDMVMIARRRKSKAEEFVLGDVSVKLVRALEGTAVLVVKSM